MREDDRRRVWGVRALTLAALIPLLAGLSSYVLNYVSIASPDSSFRTGVGRLPFTLADVDRFNDELGAFLRLTVEVGATNIVSAAALALALVRFGVARGSRSAYWAFAAFAVWEGANDWISALTFTIETGRPFVVPPTLFVIASAVGLVLTAPIARRAQLHPQPIA